MPAPCSKAAPRRWIHRRWKIAREQLADTRTLFVRIRNRHGADERARIGMTRTIVEVFSRGDLHCRAQIHDENTMADMTDDGEIVGDENQREPEVLLQIHEQVDDLRLNGHVECTDGLVADDEFRFEHQRPGDTDALALTTRELVWIAVELAALEAENERLAQLAESLQTPAEIERQARERFGLVRPGEIGVVVEWMPEAAPEPVEEPLLERDTRRWYERVWDWMTGRGYQQEE